MGYLQPEEPSNQVGEEALALVDLVVPTSNRADSVTALLSQLPLDRFASVTVVDDGSEVPVRIRPEVADRVRLVRHSSQLGASVARHRGSREGAAPYVLFVDDDITFGTGSSGDPEAAAVVRRLVVLAGEWQTGAIAPRIVSEPGCSVPARFEAARGVLDRGPASGVVAPGTRIPFVPSGVLLVQREAYEAIDGFDPAMTRGEDVDLVWRLDAAGRTVRYDAIAVVSHPVRRNWRSWLRQRHDYGRSTSELDAKHPDTVYALSISPWSVAVWVLVATGGPLRKLAGVVVWAGSIALLVPELRDRVSDPRREAFELAGGGTLFAGEALAGAIRRSWWPAAIAAGALVPRLRGPLAATLVPLLLDWKRSQPSELDALRWCATALADELAYGSGLWRGAVSTRSLRALRVRWQALDDLIVSHETEA